MESGFSSAWLRERAYIFRIVAAAILLQPAIALPWTVLDLGALPGSSNCTATAVNDSGFAVGTCEMADGHVRAFSWSAQLGMLDLGTLDGDESEATAVNNRGEVAGASSVGGVMHAFLWSSAGGMRDLGVLRPADTSTATGINDAGVVVGFSMDRSRDRGDLAFVWSVASGMRGLSALPGGQISYAAAIINSGQIAGSVSSALTGAHAVVWLTDGSVRDLGVPLTTTDASASSINNVGQVVGIGGAPDTAFIWSSRSGMQRLGDFNGVRCINDRGEAVGWQGTTRYLWADGKATSLGTLDPERSWSFGIASCLNNAAQIVGGGINADGERHAYMISPFPVVTFPKTLGACLPSGQGPGRDSSRPRQCDPGNPINPYTGNKYQIETDYLGSGPFPLRFDRYYNSSVLGAATTIGAGWRHTYDRAVMLIGVSAKVFRPDGKQLSFRQSGADWIGDPDVMDRLAQTVSGWIYTTAPDDEMEAFDTTGRLLSISDRAGISVTMTYDAKGRLSKVLHSTTGRALDFGYDPSGRLAKMTDPAGGTFRYAYRLLRTPSTRRVSSERKRFTAFRGIPRWIRLATNAEQLAERRTTKAGFCKAQPTSMAPLPAMHTTHVAWKRGGSRRLTPQMLVP